MSWMKIFTEYKRVSPIRQIVFAAKDFVQYFVFQCNQDGIEIQCMDESHISMIHAVLSKSIFHAFSCKNPGWICVPHTMLYNVFRNAPPQYSTTVTADTKNLTVLFCDVTKENRIKYTIPLLDLDYETFQFPDIDYTARVIMPSVKFQSIFKQLATIDNDKVYIHVLTNEQNENEIMFSNKSKNGTVTIILKHSKDQVSIRCETPVEQGFAIHYFQLFSRNTFLNDRVQLEMASDIPIRVKYYLDDNNNHEDESYIQYFLTPFIDEDSDDEML